MNDLRFALRQLLKKPGFTATVVLTLENSDQTPDDYRSTPKSNRPPALTRPRGSSMSLSRTKRADRFATFPSAGRDGPDSPETCGKLRARLAESHAAIGGRVARSSLCRANSRVTIKFRVRGLGKGRWIPPILRLCLIEQHSQPRPGARIVDDSLPRSITIQFGEQLWQLGNQFLPLGARELFDGFLDILHRAHALKLVGQKAFGKPSSLSHSAYFTRTSCKLRQFKAGFFQWLLYSGPDSELARTCSLLSSSMPQQDLESNNLAAYEKVAAIPAPADGLSLQFAPCGHRRGLQRDHVPPGDERASARMGGTEIPNGGRCRYLGLVTGRRNSIHLPFQ